MIVAKEMIGNITRPPNRSVRAPTGMRPSEPTTTGTATSSDCSNADRFRDSLSFGPSGDNSAQAQKLMANPAVAIASINSGRGERVAPDVAMSDSIATAAPDVSDCGQPGSNCAYHDNDRRKRSPAGTFDPVPPWRKSGVWLGAGRLQGSP